MKKILLIPLFLALICLAVSGCGKKTVMMDELNNKGFYPYANIDLSFNLSLPKDFKYFQTQVKSGDNYKDLEIFVPTADRSYLREIPVGYAKPVAVRVIDKNYYNGMNDDADKQALVKVGEKGGKIYAIKFWDTIPEDWKGKWNEEMKQSIISNFKLR